MRLLRSLFLKTISFAVIFGCAGVAYCQPGSLDLTFTPATGANGGINALGMQSDGKLIIGGSFTTYNGAFQKMVARLNTNGSWDSTFNLEVASNGSVSNVYVLKDDRIIIVGAFNIAMNGFARYNVALLNPNGSPDTNFVSSLSAEDIILAVQRDFKLITTRTNSCALTIRRLTLNGAYDTSFDEFFIPEAQGGTCPPRSLTGGTQNDGKYLVGRDLFLRFHEHGSRDSTFLASNTNKGVLAFAFQNDGKILVAGTFTNFSGVPRNRIARLNNDGTLDLSFDVGSGPNNGTNFLAIQPDGKILVAGQFTNFNGTARKWLARLNSNGSVDSAFESSNVFVSSMLQTGDGSLFISGGFVSTNGLWTNGVARLNGDAPSVPSFVTQPTNLVVKHGQETSFTCNVFSSPRARLQWKFNGVDIPDATNQVFHFPSVHFTNAGNYEVLATNALGSATSDVAELTVSRADVHAGSLDGGFQSAGTDGVVNSIAVKSDNKIVIGGSFRQIEGASRNFIAQLNPDGSLDTNFNPGLGFNDKVYAVAIQNDGKIMAGGRFTNFNRIARSRVARLNSDGTLDTTFGTTTMTGDGDLSVNALGLQSDGKIIIGGQFWSVGGHFGRAVARLRTNGLVDTSFSANLSTMDSSSPPRVNSIVVEPDNKVVIGGRFVIPVGGGSADSNIASLQTNGVYIGAFYGLPPHEEIFALVRQADGKFLIGGITTPRIIPVSPFSKRYGFIARHADVSFNVVTNAENTVRAISLQSNGKIIVAGEFLNFNNSPCRYIARLHSDGTLDHSFVSPEISDAAVLTVAALPNGKTLVGGRFANVNNTIRGGLARLNGDLKILNSAIEEPGFSVSFLADADKNYLLKYKNDLSDEDWTGLNGLSGSNGVQTLTDPSSSEAQRFYKLQAE